MGKFYIYEIIQCCGAGAEIIFLIKVFRLHNTEIILYQFLAVLRMSLDPESDVWPDPDSLGSEPFGRIRIRTNFPDPDPTIKSRKNIKEI